MQHITYTPITISQSRSWKAIARNLTGCELETMHERYEMKSVTCTATGKAGNSSSKSVNYQVIYPFSGFGGPIDSPPTVNKVKSGRAIPVEFSLGGDYGLDILASGSPSSQQVACDGGASTSDVVDTGTAGHSGLQYDADTDTYVWKTEKGWGGTCRQLSITLVDGTTHTADFQFR